MKKYLPLLLACVVPAVLPTYAAAQSTPSTDSDYRWGSRYLFDYEHLAPTTHNRHIDTDTVDAMIGKKLSNTWDLSMYAGLTGTHAHGHITRNDGLDYDGQAGGLGPSLRFQIQPWHAGPVGLTLFASGGIIFYNEDFPSQGRSYNLMWRVGPSLDFKLSDKNTLSAGATLMHVSNGQRTHNPGYDGSGPTLAFTHAF